MSFLIFLVADPKISQGQNKDCFANAILKTESATLIHNILHTCVLLRNPGSVTADEVNLFFH